MAPRKNRQIFTVNNPGQSAIAEKPRSVQSANRIKSFRSVSIIKRGDSSYLSRIKSAISTSVHNLHPRKIISSVKDYTKSFHDYITSKFRKNQDPGIITYTDGSNSNFQVNSTKHFDTFIFHENSDGTARALFTKIVDPNMWLGKTQEQKSVLQRKYIKRLLKRMDNLDIHIFKKLLWANKNKIPCDIDKLFQSNSFLYLFLIIFIKKQESALEFIKELLQQWYLLKPVLVQVTKYSGGIVDNYVESVLIDLDKMYAYLLILKENETNELKHHLSEEESESCTSSATLVSE